MIMLLLLLGNKSRWAWVGEVGSEKEREPHLEGFRSNCNISKEAGLSPFLVVQGACTPTSSEYVAWF